MRGCRLGDSRGDVTAVDIAVPPGSLDELYRAVVAGLTAVLGAFKVASCCAQSPPVQSNPRTIEVETVCCREILIMFPYTLVGSGIGLQEVELLFIFLHLQSLLVR